MNEETRLEIFGTKELSDLFNEMSTDIQKNVVNTGFRKASKIILDQAKTNLDQSTKAPEKFKKKLGTKAAQGELALLVGEKKGGAGSLAHLLESGTKKRYYKTSSKSSLFKKSVKGTHYTGAMKATQFFENALDTTETQVITSIYDYIKQAFEKLITKYEGKKKE
jgi:phage protein, HK97 gp10 family